jgi:hypothetical protein
MRDLRAGSEGKSLGKSQHLAEDPASALRIDRGLPFLDLHLASGGGNYA